ncbi:hypothetical protein A2631_05755 [Candidatus Daviesbacteria bacterium RIFCSPHIGHO2_01_FULL_44_29]|uniref:2'-deoxynucleoside 5'-phosphate N-hydrolase 1 n=1 Tax=Candidatus Daviesbacteria bacterium RIFCSPHIGHO2_02_FULL_43_12 TaxID=1797776 RepID=A0A1F5KI73_9BACT|nr:MAG: hypothetical protein A2631_05755 [Candidatus Daviesbacteria bacterium RIFCSPHIGHO2_01_FULL_44_29]OGE39483.1 MAG: hypothetical protein A3E86_04005 [Candidatus Daviesbacteria bacterium RIFCSPHIGHO2_12_FULL_47_45]OGE40643.1 MAG: hypothetical protein A3D25_05795 [Candidatus Daviesbacteria bacterium RIFCSPHIGHO2_02_FULL_43_12]OGE69861.1 MAG: hypothetical protein A3B55_05630 [Candidatus Daviesbacteria bacterium RIFCSPLOWO2_01_FULL_43_15]
MAKKLDIYFACSIRGFQGAHEEKALIVRLLKELGHNVLSEQFVNLTRENNEATQGMDEEMIYKRDLDWVKNSDIIVAHYSPSTGMGYEIGYKDAIGGRVLVLHKGELSSVTAMIQGNKKPTFKLHVWESEEDLKEYLKQELGEVDQ